MRWLTCVGLVVDEDGGKVDVVMSVVLVLQEHDLLVLDGCDLTTSVGPDLSAAHVDGDDQEDEADPRPPVHHGEVEVILRLHKVEDER